MVDDVHGSHPKSADKLQRVKKRESTVVAQQGPQPEPLPAPLRPSVPLGRLQLAAQRLLHEYGRQGCDEVVSQMKHYIIACGDACLHAKVTLCQSFLHSLDSKDFCIYPEIR